MFFSAIRLKTNKTFLKVNDTRFSNYLKRQCIQLIIMLYRTLMYKTTLLYISNLNIEKNIFKYGSVVYYNSFCYPLLSIYSDCTSQGKREDKIDFKISVDENIDLLHTKTSSLIIIGRVFYSRKHAVC